MIASKIWRNLMTAVMACAVTTFVSGVALPASAADEHAETKAGDGHEHGAAGHGHDATDLGHQNATKALSSPIDFRFDLAVWTFVVFFLLVAILGKFAWGPIKEGLEKREQGIANQIAEANLSAKKAAEQLKLYEAKLAAAADEARAIALEAKREAELARDTILAQAKAGAERERTRAIEDITAAKNNALQEIAEKSVNTAIKLAGSIVRREIRGDEHAALIREAVDKFPSSN